MSDHHEILEQAAAWRSAGKGVALATVVSTWGSSPRPAGAKLAVADRRVLFVTSANLTQSGVGKNIRGGPAYPGWRSPGPRRRTCRCPASKR